MQVVQRLVPFVTLQLQFQSHTILDGLKLLATHGNAAAKQDYLWSKTSSAGKLKAGWTCLVAGGVMHRTLCLGTSISTTTAQTALMLPRTLMPALSQYLASRACLPGMSTRLSLTLRIGIGTPPCRTSGRYLDSQLSLVDADLLTFHCDDCTEPQE